MMSKRSLSFVTVMVVVGAALSVVGQSLFWVLHANPVSENVALATVAEITEHPDVHTVTSEQYRWHSKALTAMSFRRFLVGGEFTDVSRTVFRPAGLPTDLAANDPAVQSLSFSDVRAKAAGWDVEGDVARKDGVAVVLVKTDNYGEDTAITIPGDVLIVQEAPPGWVHWALTVPAGLAVGLAYLVARGLQRGPRRRLYAMLVLVPFGLIVWWMAAAAALGGPLAQSLTDTWSPLEVPPMHIAILIAALFLLPWPSSRPTPTDPHQVISPPQPLTPSGTPNA